MSANSPASIRPHASETRSPSRRHGLGFWAVAFAFVTMMAYSAVPTPLYSLYAARDGFGSLTITIIFAAYALGVVISLFLFGHLSDWHGRRRVLVTALLTSAASAVIFILWRDLAGLLVARVVAGLGVGAATATATAWLSELHAGHRPDAPPRRAEVVGIAANLGGIGAGPLVAGVLAQWVTGPLTVPYVISLVLLCVATALVALTPETREVLSPRPAYRAQRVSLPADARPAFFAASLAGFVGFAAFALFTSLAPSFLAGTLGHPSRALAGAAAFVVFGGAAAAQAAMARSDRRTLVGAGAAAMLPGAALMVVALWLHRPSLALFLIGGLLLGVGAGALFKGAVVTVVAIAEAHHRAEALAGLFLASYVGLALPAVGLGVLTQHVQAKVALLVFAGLVAIGMLASVGPLLNAGGQRSPQSA